MVVVGAGDKGVVVKMQGAGGEGTDDEGADGKCSGNGQPRVHAAAAGDEGIGPPFWNLSSPHTCLPQYLFRLCPLFVNSLAPFMSPTCTLLYGSLGPPF